MKTEQIQRLIPFVDGVGKGFSPKSKLIVFFLASGYSPSEIRDITIDDLSAIKDLKRIPSLVRSIDLLKGGKKNDLLFCYPSSRKYSEAYIVSILERSYAKQGLRYKNLDSFIKKIKGTK